MSETWPNCKPKPKPAALIELPNHQGFLISMSDDDPDTEVSTTVRPAEGLIPRMQSEPVASLREEQADFQRDMEVIERGRGFRFFYWRDVWEAIHELGYRQVAPSRVEQDPTAETKS